MFVQISYPFFTLLFVKLAEENEFGIVKMIYLWYLIVYFKTVFISVTLLKISPVKILRPSNGLLRFDEGRNRFRLLDTKTPCSSYLESKPLYCRTSA